MSPKLSQTIDCIIPFYNEGLRVGAIVSEALKSPYIRRVICVDDGSVDTSILLPKDPRIVLCRHTKNLGKTEAVRTGLKHVRTIYTFLVDADLLGFTVSMINECIRHVLAANLDLFILRRKDTVITSQWLRLDILFAGERIMRTDLLRRALQGPIVGYQMEAAMNQYALVKKLKTGLIYLPFIQYRKVAKHGYVKGLWREFLAMRQVAQYRGLMDIARQIAIFRPRRVQLPNIFS